MRLLPAAVWIVVCEVFARFGRKETVAIPPRVVHWRGDEYVVSVDPERLKVRVRLNPNPELRRRLERNLGECQKRIELSRPTVNPVVAAMRPEVAEEHDANLAAFAEVEAGIRDEMSVIEAALSEMPTDEIVFEATVSDKPFALVDEKFLHRAKTSEKSLAKTRGK
ncbi:MAG: hypothetical protein KIS66_16795 [Fimbriimonadaceae bacterium]|nr:hypothetical protein [Fimbriimonadaceae bacterium]